jgi:hypothetical protein
VTSVRRVGGASRLAVAGTAVLAAALVATSAATTVGASAGERPPPKPPGGDRGTTERLALAAGLQVGAKHRNRPQVTVKGRRYAAPNPYLADLPGNVPVDWSYWHRRLRTLGERRSAHRLAQRGVLARQVPTPVVYSEQEPADRLGRNDTQATSEHLTDVGLGRPSQAAQVSGTLFRPGDGVTGHRGTREDQGSIRQATHSGVGYPHQRVVVRSRIGDGPHGSRRDGTGDFDFYAVRGRAGRTLTATTRGSNLDTVLALYDGRGHLLAANDDAGDSYWSSLTYPVTTTGNYYVMVAGYSDSGPVPASPFRSGSGSGAGDEGVYQLAITSQRLDQDQYGVYLHSGDVLAGTLTGRATDVAVNRVDGRRMVDSQVDLSSSYPLQSPLPGGGSTFAYVAEEPGWYSVEVSKGTGAYRLLLETYPPGTTRGADHVQTIFLDFDGERVNTAVFGGPGVSTLSPMSRFLGRWGLTAADENAVIDSTVASVKENLQQTLVDEGLNHQLDVRVLNSRDDPDPTGDPDVSRVIIGGTVAESGVPTIGIASSIDPGNYAHEDTALVLLDDVSSDASVPWSFNHYLRPSSDRVAFVGRTLGTLAAHEAGHFIGSFHTDNSDKVANLMDAGGANFALMYGVGPDRVGGTADDRDVDFGEDAYSPDEGFAGLEDTLNNSAWAFLPDTTTP